MKDCSGEVDVMIWIPEVLFKLEPWSGMLILTAPPPKGMLDRFMMAAGEDHPMLQR